MAARITENQMMLSIAFRFDRIRVQKKRVKRPCLNWAGLLSGNDSFMECL